MVDKMGAPIGFVCDDEVSTVKFDEAVFHRTFAELGPVSRAVIFFSTWEHMDAAAIVRLFAQHGGSFTEESIAQIYLKAWRQILSAMRTASEAARLPFEAELEKSEIKINSAWLQLDSGGSSANPTSASRGRRL